MLKFDSRNFQFKLVMQGALNVDCMRILNADPEERYLITKTGKRQLTLVSSLLNSPKFARIEMPTEDLKGSTENNVDILVDFHALGHDKLAVFSSNGTITIYSISTEKTKILLAHDIFSELAGGIAEFVTSATITRSEKPSKSIMISVACKNELEQLSSFRTFVLRIEEDHKVVIEPSNLVQFKDCTYS